MSRSRGVRGRLGSGVTWGQGSHEVRGHVGSGVTWGQGSRGLRGHVGSGVTCGDHGKRVTCGVGRVMYTFVGMLNVLLETKATFQHFILMADSRFAKVIVTTCTEKAACQRAV